MSSYYTYYYLFPFQETLRPNCVQVYLSCVHSYLPHSGIYTYHTTSKEPLLIPFQSKAACQRTYCHLSAFVLNPDKDKSGSPVSVCCRLPVLKFYPHGIGFTGHPGMRSCCLSPHSPTGHFSQAWIGRFNGGTVLLSGVQPLYI